MHEQAANPTIAVGKRMNLFKSGVDCSEACAEVDADYFLENLGKAEKNVF